jgi:hypothetical protein
LGSCVFTTDTSSVATADVVWFDWREVEELPSIKRPEGALWLYFGCCESPARADFRHDDSLALMNSEINLLVSYELDADIPIPLHFFVSKRSSRIHRPIMPEWSMDKKLVISFISDDKAPSRNRRLDVCCCCCVLLSLFFELIFVVVAVVIVLVLVLVLVCVVVAVVIVGCASLLLLVLLLVARVYCCWLCEFVVVGCERVL